MNIPQQATIKIKDIEAINLRGREDGMVGIGERK